MKKSFVGYYPPTEEQYKKLWSEGLIVLDTNVLLNLYRLPTTARDDFIKVLEILKDRLWIPHQVALEFQKNRLTVIAGERKTTEEVLKELQELVTCAKSKVNSLELDKRNLSIEPTTLLDELEKANNQLVTAIKKAHDSLIGISASDPIREKIDTLLFGRVGCGPQTQNELDQLIQGGDERFANKIPPGFEDSKKGNNPNDATFLFDQIKYQRKFGDLILWRQLLQHVKNNDIKTVLLVTGDQKDDWWWREYGKTLGPLPELSREIAKEGCVDLFWMYSSKQFFEKAPEFTAVKIDKASVEEMEKASRSTEFEYLDHPEYLVHSHHARLLRDKKSELRNLDGRSISDVESFDDYSVEHVINWLNSQGMFVDGYYPTDPSLYYNVSNSEMNAYKICICRSIKNIYEKIYEVKNEIGEDASLAESLTLIFALKTGKNLTRMESIDIEETLDLIYDSGVFKNLSSIVFGWVTKTEFIPLAIKPRKDLPRAGRSF